MAERARPTGGEWWRTAVVYEVYIRSFADGDGDGHGDIAGLRTRLPYLAALGVDALWITPWFRSPLADGGYDISDYRDVDPVFGDLAEADAFIADAHAYGIRVILDLVANHTSIEHPWFRRAIADRDAPERALYWLRPGRGQHGELPPNNWRSVFGGPAWTRLPDGDWYLHLFAPEQPDLNWSNPDVVAEFDEVLRWWFDRGVDGFRVDVAHGFAKHPNLPDLPNSPEQPPDHRLSRDDATGAEVADHPHWDRDDVHELFRRWRQIADSYAGTPQGPRAFVAEAWRIRRGGLFRYLRPDELHTAFNFDFLKCPWEPAALRATIDQQLSSLAAVGATPTWVLSSHDLIRPVTRLGTDGSTPQAYETSGVVDLERGTRRARAAALLTLALPGSTYIYQGNELGLPEVEELPEHALRDPMWERSGRRVRGRDGCRVPLPWTANGPTFGFSTGDSSWLPQPSWWGKYAVDRQQHDLESALSLYRHATQLRRDRLALLPETRLRWDDDRGIQGVLAFKRGPAFTCLINFSDRPVQPPPDSKLLLASSPLCGGMVPTDTAVWLEQG